MSAEELLQLTDEAITEGEWTLQDIVDQVQIDEHKAKGEEINELDKPALVEDAPVFSLSKATDVMLQLEKLFQSRPEKDFRDCEDMLKRIRRGFQKEIALGLKQQELTNYFTEPTNN